MASELRVNTLKDASGNNSVATSVIAEGTAKAWANIDGSGTVSFRDSFNTSGLTDNGTGDYTTSFSTSLETQIILLLTAAHLMGQRQLIR